MSAQFKLFQRLPYELRTDIWRSSAVAEAQATPRIHRIAPTAFQWEVFCLGKPEFTVVALPRKQVPSHLHTCRESRKAASKLYELWRTGDNDPIDRDQPVRDNPWAENLSLEEVQRMELETLEHLRPRIYISKQYDTFLFTNEASTKELGYFSFINTIAWTTFGIAHDAEFLNTARNDWMPVIEGIKHWAITFDIWSKIVIRHTWRNERLQFIKWSETICKAEKVTIVIHDSFWDKTVNAYHFRDLKPTTTPGTQAFLIMKSIEDFRDIILRRLPHLTWPAFEVKCISPYEMGEFCEHYVEGDRFHDDETIEGLLQTQRRSNNMYWGSI